MANLLTEYCKRHGAEFILPTNDGLCFFNEHKRPALVCMTSNTPKSHTTCHLCGTPESMMIIELFEPSREDLFSYHSHKHVVPDTDLVSYVKNQGLTGLTPVYLKSGRDIELWLWNFFLFHYRLRYSKTWKEWTEELRTCDEPNRSYEQMTHCAIKYPKTYNVYYAMFQVFTAGRKYLLFE